MSERKSSSFTVKVKCCKPKTEIIKEENGVVHLNVKGRAIKGEANKEIIKFFSKKFKSSVRILKGKRSSVKVLKVE